MCYSTVGLFCLQPFSEVFGPGASSVLYHLQPGGLTSSEGKASEVQIWGGSEVVTPAAATADAFVIHQMTTFQRGLQPMSTVLCSLIMDQNATHAKASIPGDWVVVRSFRRKH
ncbi:hypothetical protein XENOCAPTIV_025155 [Xenoophorus captivus]|uniref:Uncharacterized protein n=1 Tax=Xenoophorus captivus TaxID=1517983 RepID=A0ABV0R615_9TELE